MHIVHVVKGRQFGNQAWETKAEGDDVYENEFIHTTVKSHADLVLVDRTDLSIGPLTTIRVDQIVRNPDQSIKSIVISTGPGAVRWTSGKSRDDRIRTPNANITPLGTMFDLFVDDRRTFVILRQGSVRVCPNNLRRNCKILDSPSQMILATAGELKGPVRGGPDPADFANQCLSATGQKCVIELTLSPPPRNDIQPSPPPGVEKYIVPPRRYDHRRHFRPMPPAVEKYIVPPRRYDHRRYFRPMPPGVEKYGVPPRRYDRRRYFRPMYPTPLYTPRRCFNRYGRCR